MATIVLIAIVVLILLGLAGRAFRRVAVPVGDLVEASGRVETGDFSARVPEEGPREVRSLARAFNSMSSRLEEMEQQRQSTLADVSHELRTPLTVIQGTVEAMLDGVYPSDPEHLEPILEQARLMERLIDDLRTLTLAEAGRLVLHREPTDLGALLPDVAAGTGARPSRPASSSSSRWPRPSRSWTSIRPESGKLWPTCWPTPCATPRPAAAWTSPRG